MKKSILSASADSPFDRLVLQPETTEGSLGLSSLFGGGVEFIRAGASAGEILAAIRSASYPVLCDPLEPTEAASSGSGEWHAIEGLDPLRVALARVAWTTRRNSTTVGHVRTVHVRNCHWRTDGWGSFEVSVDTPGSVPTSGIVEIESLDTHPLLQALLGRRGFGDPIRLGSDPAEVEAGLALLGRQLSATRCAIVHRVDEPRRGALGKRITEALGATQLVHTIITLFH